MRISENTSSIRRYEDVAHLDNGMHRHFTAGESPSRLVFFGSRHVWDASDPMFAEIKALADSTQPDLFFVEGLQGLRRDAPSAQRTKWLQDIATLSLDDAICSFGERGFIVKYAAERGLGVECPEPAFADEIRHITQQSFSRDAIIGYYVYRMVHQWLNTPGAASLEIYLAPTIEELKRLTAWSDYDWSFENIASLSEKFWQVPLKLDDRRFYLNGISPFTKRKYKEAKDTNEVCAASSLFRDQTIAREIIAARERAQSIFVVFGSGHSHTLEEALKRGFGTPISL